MQFVFADTNRGIRPDRIELQVSGHVAHSYDPHIRKVIEFHGATGYFDCPLVDIHSPDFGIWAQLGQSHGDCTTTTAKVEQHATSWHLRILNEHSGAPIEFTVVEYAAVASQRELQFAHLHLMSSRRRGRCRVWGEVVIR